MAAVHAASALQASAVSSSAVPTSSFRGEAVTVRGLPSLAARPGPARRLTIEASSKKVNVKLPLGLSKDTKFKNGVDAGGRKSNGKGVYQYTKKYGANVDGYSPIYAEEDWAKSGNSYAGGQAGLALWAITLGGLLVGGVFLVYSTSALG